MRQATERQRRLDGGSVSRVVWNLNCRDELIPILRGLQQVYATPQVRDAILKLVKRDVLVESRSDRGRAGLSDWCILDLAAVRLGCNWNDDKLHDLAENHRALRSIMEIGEFDETHFSWKRIRDNVCLLQPATIESISQLIVDGIRKIIESAIGGLQSGNGQKHCRDRGELGLERYLALGILARNLHTFGRLLIQREAPNSEAARTQRGA